MEQQQQKLFHESVEDALTTDVLACGGYKKVGSHLRTDLTSEQAAAWLRACLNIERNEKLGPGQVIEIKRLARANDSHATITYEAQQLGFKVEWLEPEDERAALQRQFIQSIAQQKQILQRLESLPGHPVLRVAG